MLAYPAYWHVHRFIRILDICTAVCRDLELDGCMHACNGTQRFSPASHCVLTSIVIRERSDLNIKDHQHRPCNAILIPASAPPSDRHRIDRRVACAKELSTNIFLLLRSCPCGAAIALMASLLLCIALAALAGVVAIDADPGELIRQSCRIQIIVWPPDPVCTLSTHHACPGAPTNPPVCAQ